MEHQAKRNVPCSRHDAEDAIANVYPNVTGERSFNRELARYETDGERFDYAVKHLVRRANAADKKTRSEHREERNAEKAWAQSNGTATEGPGSEQPQVGWYLGPEV